MVLSVHYVVSIAFSGLVAPSEFSLTGPQPDSRFGHSIAGVADIDGDGIVDLLVGAPVGASDDPAAANPLPYVGLASWHSGTDGTLLLSHNGDKPGDGFGFAVAVVGDGNLDGFIEYAIGAPRRSSTFDAFTGAVNVYSGATSASLYQLVGDDPNDAFGSSITALGDISTDGIPDFAVGAPTANATSSTLLDCGRVRIYSVGSGTVLKTLLGSMGGDHFGAALDSIDDLNGDGRRELLVGAPEALDSITSERLGRVSIIQASGNVLAKFLGPHSQAEFGRSLGSIPDLDGDLRPEVAIGSPGSNLLAPVGGSVFIRSSGTGALLLQWAGDAPDQRLGQRIAAAPDCDGDGFSDIAACDSSALWIASSTTGSSLARIDPSPPSMGAPRGIAILPDADGDAQFQWAVGWPYADLPNSNNVGIVTQDTIPDRTPTLRVEPSIPVQITTALGQPSPTTQLTLISECVAALEIEVSTAPSAPWLVLEAHEATLPHFGSTASLDISVDPKNLLTGNATTTLEIRDSISDALLATVPVVVNLTGSVDLPQLGVSGPQSIALAATNGASPPAPSVLRIFDSAAASLSLGFQVRLDPAVDWLTLSANAGVLPPHAAPFDLTVTPLPELAEFGAHTCKILVENTANPLQRVEIPVHLFRGGVALQLGDRATGTATPQETDIAVFDGLKGMQISFAVESSQSNRPIGLELLDPSGNVVKAWTAKPSSPTKSMKLTMDGPWRLEVQSVGSEATSYTLVSKRKKFGSKAKSTTAKFDLAPEENDFAIYSFQALPSANLDLELKTKHPPLGDVVLTLESPNGVQTLLSHSVFSETTAVALGIELESLGTYRLTVANGSTVSSGKLKWKLAQPPAGSRLVVLDP